MKLRNYFSATVFSVIVGYTFFFGSDLAAKITVYIGLVAILFIMSYALEKQEKK